MEKLALETANVTDKNIEKILELFPNVATEAVGEDGELKRAIDFKKLKQELSSVVVEGEESYDFTWVGKKEAMIEANKPIRKTLRPDRDSSVDWENTQNIYIEGDNLEALKLLQESYLGKVKMIYIDPPYNTGKDFVYRDNFTQDKDSYEEELGITDEEGNKLFQNTESNGRFHSDWCSMIYPRLKLARNLLSDNGVIFISIDDNEVRNMQNICDEIFGNENYIANLIWRRKTGSSDAKCIATITEYILVYAKSISGVNETFSIDKNSYDIERYKLSDEYEEERGKHYIDNLDRGSLGYIASLDFGILAPDGTLAFPNGRTEKFNDGWRWTWGKDKVEWGLKNGFIEFRKTPDKPCGWKVCRKNYLKVNNEGKPFEKGSPYKNLILDILNTQATIDLQKLLGAKIFDYSKPIELLKLLINLLRNKDYTILDFFSGSATTAHAVMQLNAEDGGNRKFICVQLPETTDEKSEAYKAGYKTICEIGEERIRRAGKKIQEENPDKKIDVGFRVFKVDDTNVKDVYYSPKEYSQIKLGQFESNIKEDRTDEDLLYGVLLDWGVELSLPHKVEMVEGKKVHIVNDDDLIACFEDDVPDSVVRHIANLKPTRVVFKDSSFKTDDHKINVEEIFKLISPDTTVKVI